MKKLLEQLKRYYATHVIESKTIFQLVDIDVTKSIVKLQVKNKKTILKVTVATLMQSTWLLTSLSPQDACQIGVFYGATLPEPTAPCSPSLLPTSCAFHLKSTTRRYQLISEDREHLLHYLDTITQQVLMEHPLAMVQNAYVIQNFDATQAYYIGYLAGIAYDKLEPAQLQAFALQSALRLVE